MGLKVEFNSVLALRKSATPGFLSNECAPLQPRTGVRYSFLKKEHRVYPINTDIPLLVTKGGRDFIALVGFIKILSYTVSSELGEGIYTVGTYEFVSLSSQSESDIYLGLGREPENA